MKNYYVRATRAAKLAKERGKLKIYEQGND